MPALLKPIFALLVLELAVLHIGSACPQVVISEAQLREMIQCAVSESLVDVKASLHNLSSTVNSLQQQLPATTGGGSATCGGSTAGGSSPTTAGGSPTGNSNGGNDGSSPCRPACSCDEILSNNPNAPSGDYWIKTSDGQARYLFCDMTRTCGGVSGGWTRVGFLDTANSSQACPSGLTERTVGDRRTCTAVGDGRTCSSVYYQSPPFSRVCGRINGYFDDSLDGFMNFGRGTNLNLDDNYVDGASLTHGEPRGHIWTFAVASVTECDCGTPPAAVGADHFCDFRRIGTTDLVNPLWAGPTCGDTNSTAPWFFQEIRRPTTDPVEMRVCRDESRGNEDLLLESVEIYVL